MTMRKNLSSLLGRRVEESSKYNDVTELVDKAVIVVLLAPLTVVTLLLLLLMIEAIDEKSLSSE